MNKKKENKTETKKPKGIPIPVGTEQETGLTRGETEKKGKAQTIPASFRKKLRKMLRKRTVR